MRGLKVPVFFALCLAVFAVAGCGEKDLSKPPKILYGRDTCAQCRMIIQDERFACAAVSSEQRYLKFDDMGCLAEYEKRQGVRAPLSWVHDLAGTGWTEKNEAHFVYFQDLVTPMGYGAAAFVSEEGAKKFVAEKGGRVMTWEELLSLNGK